MRTPASRTRSTVAVLFGWVIATTPVLGLPVTARDPGDQLWVSTYNGPDNVDDAGYIVEVSPGGSTVFVAGETNLLERTDFGAVAYDAASGDQLWDVTLGRAPNDYVSDLAVSPQGDAIYVSGWSAAYANQFYTTVAWDAASGTQLWVRTYDLVSTDESTAMVVSPDGTRVFVTGFSSLEHYDYATVAYDAATGDQLWVSRYHGGGPREDYAEDIAVSPDGSKVFVTGFSEGPGDTFDYATVAYDAATGSQLWVRRFGGRLTTEYARAIGVSPDGSRVFVTGESSRAYATVAYGAATGSSLWMSRFDRGTDPYSLAVSPDGARVLVTGYNDLIEDFVTVAYDASTGTGLWFNQYDGFGGTDIAHSIVVSPEGSMVFVTGESPGPDGIDDFATVAYDALAGDQVWASRYDGPEGGEDEAFSVAVAPDGAAVFVTGSSFASGTGLDFATVAYSA